MTLVFFKNEIVRICLWLRHHWQVPFLVVWTVMIYILTRKNTSAVIETMEAKKESYRKQLQILKDSHSDEILKREQLSKRYEETLLLLEEKFKKDQKDLTKKQKSDIKEVVIKSKGNPDEIKRRIQEEFGFELVQ